MASYPPEPPPRFPRRRDVAAGAVAGFLGGLIFAAAMQEQRMSVPVTGIAGLPGTGPGVVLHLALGTMLGGALGGVHRYEGSSHAATTSAGVLYSVLAWIIGPLTLKPLFDGASPTWSVEAATIGFPSLVGHMLFGGTTGLGFHLITALDRRLNPHLVVSAFIKPERKRVVILGSGFGGIAAAQRLEALGVRDPRIEVTLVSQHNYLLFTPMLAEVASSGLEAQHISAPVRAACPRTSFLRAEVEWIDTEAHQIGLRVGLSAASIVRPYDQLILALGSVPNFYDLPGLEANAFTLKSLDDAVLLRNRVIASLEQADVEPDPEIRRRLCTFVVIGGGFAGTETIAELADLVRSARRYYPNLGRSDLRFVLVHSGERILPELNADLGDYARRKLEARGVEVLLQSRLESATSEAVSLQGGRKLPTHTFVWAAGNQANPLLGSLPCELSRGQMPVDGALRVKGLEDVWAVGDCAQVPDPDNAGGFCPPTAQHAIRQGKLAAENVRAALHDKPTKEFSFQPIGSLVGLGHRTAAAEIRGRQFSGLFAWLLWRSIYLGKLPGLERKVRVSLDWLADLFFPRDIVLTSIPDPPGWRRGPSGAGMREPQPTGSTPGERGADE